jgi:catechol 2,3-dioxygenase-like lactoylglutathione lyase family enzyme
MTAKLPSRLHHTAYVSKNLEATRAFYEDVLGIPLVATWCETDFLFGKDRTYCHLFFGLGDGSALAFFSSPTPRTRRCSGPSCRPRRSATSRSTSTRRTQAELEARIARPACSRRRPTRSSTATARSVYVEDPDGMIVEFTCDDPRAAAGDAYRRSIAHAELKRWLAGDHTTNNDFRHEEAA